MWTKFLLSFLYSFPTSISPSSPFFLHTHALTQLISYFTNCGTVLCRTEIPFSRRCRSVWPESRVLLRHVLRTTLKNLTDRIVPLSVSNKCSIGLSTDWWLFIVTFSWHIVQTNKLHQFHCHTGLASGRGTWERESSPHSFPATWPVWEGSLVFVCKINVSVN